MVKERLRHKRVLPAKPRAGKLQKKATMKRRKSPGWTALRDIRKYQSSTALFLRRQPFSRLVRALTDEVSGTKAHFRWRQTSLLALQEALEAHITNRCHLAYMASIAGRRITLSPGDLQLVDSVLTYSGEAPPQPVLRQKKKQYPEEEIGHARVLQE